MPTVTAPTLINRLGRAIGTRFRGVKGVDRILRALHHPDKRGDWYFETVAQALPNGPKYNIQSRWFTEWTTYFYGSQDKAIHRWIQTNAKPDWVAFDIGMNFGYFACLLGQNCSQVHGFEPIPWLAERAMKNVKLNGLSNVHINEVALSDATGSADINVPSRSDANWGTSSLVHTSSSTDQLRVAAQTLDEYVGQQNLARLDFIKLDVEGAENLVLEGAKTTLERCRPTIIFERNEESASACLTMLESLRYNLYSLDGAVLDPHDRSNWPHDVMARVNSTPRP